MLAAEMVVRVPAAHRPFLAGFGDMAIVGDYAFVHAGVRPDAPLSEQRTADLRWIRSPFLDHRGTLEKMVVHGHTVLEEVEYRTHRIGIDTGAYRTGRLTALALEADTDWVLQTAGPSTGKSGTIQHCALLISHWAAIDRRRRRPCAHARRCGTLLHRAR